MKLAKSKLQDMLVKALVEEATANIEAQVDEMSDEVLVDLLESYTSKTYEVGEYE